MKPFDEDFFDDDLDWDAGINPASGLPMIDGSNIDVMGNFYGFSDEDLHYEFFEFIYGDDL